MSQENMELAHQAADAFNRRDLDGYLALMDDDVEVIALEIEMEGGYHGHAGIRRWWESLFDVFPDYAAEVGEVRDLGDVTLAPVRLHGHAARSDTPTDMPVWLAAEWRDGKVVWWGAYPTEAEALEAAGLRE
jgi:ketosteroid isomerase-like protein